MFLRVAPGSLNVHRAELRMRKAKAAKRLLVLVVVMLLLGAGGLYLAASSIPEGYNPNPAQLNRQARNRIAFGQFTQHVLLDPETAAGKNKPFTWSASQRQLNDYLASMYEIAAMPVRDQRGRLEKMMEKVGVADPFVALDDGVMTLMCRLTAYRKIVSAELSFSFTPAGKLRVRLGRTRIGRLPVPRSLIRERLQRLKRMLRARLAKGGPAHSRPAGGDEEGSGTAVTGSPGMSADIAGKLLGAVIAAVDEEPIATELVLPLSKKLVRIEAIDIDDGLLTLYAVPIRRGGRGD